MDIEQNQEQVTDAPDVSEQVTEQVADSTPAVPAESSEGVAPTGADAVKPAPAAAEAAAPAWTPDLTYKFQGEVKPIDEFFRPLIKDEESLKKVRDYIERAEALDLHKGKSKTYEEKLAEYEPVVSRISQLQEAFETAKTPKDHMKILGELGYTSDILKDVVREILTFEKLPDDQKAQLRAMQEAEFAKSQLQRQNEEVTSQLNSVLADVTRGQISLELGKADYKDLIQAFETANGEGSFERLFLERGAYWVNKEGRHLPPNEVMSRITKEFAPFLNMAKAAQPVAGAQAAAAPKVITNKPKTIPTVGSAASSGPAQGQISSIEDLRARYKQLTNQE